MTPKQVAAELGCSERLIYKLVASGQLEHTRIGFGRGKLDVSPGELADYRLRCRNRPPGAPPAARPTAAGVEVPDFDAVMRAARRGSRRA